MEHYTRQGDFYIPDEGYIFKHKQFDLTTDHVYYKFLDKYEIVEIPPEPETDEVDYETAYNEITEVLENVD